MTIETTLTIPVEDIIQQSQQLQLDPETYDSGKVLQELVCAYIEARRSEDEWEKRKEELECERDEALSKLEDAELLLREARLLITSFNKLWEGHKPTRTKAYEVLDMADTQVAADVGEVFSDVAGRLAELSYVLTGK